MAAVASVPYSPSTMYPSQEQKSCGGCHSSVEVDTGGVVVAFGNSLWHVDCFKCAKCGDRVSADTNLLLLSDGSPVCASCTYNCAVCKQPISDEAIMTGDESYHAACFTCKTCGRHIGELVFAKTTQGIYCMACHNERVARSRRHAEQRRNRSKPRRDGHREKEKLQETPHLQLKDTSTTTVDMQSFPNTPGFPGPDILHPDAAVSYATKRLSIQSITATLQDSLHPAKSLQQEHHPPGLIPPGSANAPPSPTAATPRIPPEPPQSTGPRPNSTSAPLTDVLQLPGELEYTGIHRLLDDGARPTNNLLSPEAALSQSRPSSSAGRATRADKRSSINPATRLEWLAVQASPDSQLHTLPPSSDVSNNHQPQQSHSRLRNSDEYPASQASRSRGGGSTRSPVDSICSPPTSPSVLTTSSPQPSAENANSQIKESTATKNHTLQDRPSPSNKPSRQTSPVLSSNNLAVDDVAGAPTSPPMETADRELPQFPVDVGLELDRRTSQDDGEDAPQTVPVTLPPIRFSASDTNFNDLFKLGIVQSPQHPVDTIENPKEDSRHCTGDESFEAGLSKLVPPNAGASSPKVSSSSSPTAKSLPHPLTNLPKRSASLARKMSSRKPVPKAIILSDPFDADTTFDLDGSSNDISSPGHVEFQRKISDSVATPTRRPASAGSSASPSHVAQTSIRRSSDHAQSGSPLATLAGPMRSRLKPTVTIVDPNTKLTMRPVASKQSSTELVTRRIKEALADAQESGASTVGLDREFLEIVCSVVQTNHEKLFELRGKFDRMRRTSQQVMDGLSVAQEEYDKELAARRDAEAEVTRLRVQLSGQAARLTQLSAEDRKREIGEQMSRDLSANLDGLERDLSRIMAERDLAVAEVEELTASKTAATHGDGGLQRSLTHRFDNLKNQYKRELEPLLRQREALLREINELKEERHICLEEATALNARNEELAQLNAQTTRHIESTGHTGDMRAWSSMPSTTGAQQPQQVPTTPKMGSMPSVVAGYSTLSQDERDEPKLMSSEKKSKWFKPSREPMRPLNDAHMPSLEQLRHNFQQLTVLRVARCDHCGDKMWGTQLRCTLCNFGCHNRCASQVTPVCLGDNKVRDDAMNGALLQPSMFGRDLIEQVRAESVREHRDIPIIVEKCIEAVERLAMDYEGIYRKTGGSAQSKAITQLFERGNYETIDLGDAGAFNDISSVTSVLKTYFRQLPNPLLTNALHEAFISGASIRDPRGKAESLTTLVYQLPSEHFHTLRYLMLHLHRIQSRSAENFMTARNLGVVFGPTLMRASDLNREYSDMAGKALAIEWLVENGPTVFREES